MHHFSAPCLDLYGLLEDWRTIVFFKVMSVNNLVSISGAITIDLFSTKGLAIHIPFHPLIIIENQIPLILRFPFIKVYAIDASACFILNAVGRNVIYIQESFIYLV